RGTVMSLGGVGRRQRSPRLQLPPATCACARTQRLRATLFEYGHALPTPSTEASHPGPPFVEHSLLTLHGQYHRPIARLPSGIPRLIPLAIIRRHPLESTTDMVLLATLGVTSTER